MDIETFKRWSIPVLQNFLRVRNLSSTGKKKSELVALAYSASIMNIPPVKTTEEEQKERAFVYSDFLKTDDGVLPDPLHDLRDGWVGESKGCGMWPPPCTTTYLITLTMRSLGCGGKSYERDCSSTTRREKHTAILHLGG